MPSHQGFTYFYARLVDGCRLRWKAVGRTTEL